MKRGIWRQSWRWGALLALLAMALWMLRQPEPSATSPSSADSSLGAPASTPPNAASERPGGLRPGQNPYADLPAQARETLRLIRQGGPYPYRQDGGVFQNREGHLPQREYGFYREYTVATPGSHDRGARRIVSGGHPPREFWYTDDHYRSFRRLPPQ